MIGYQDIIPNRIKMLFKILIASISAIDTCILISNRTPDIPYSNTIVISFMLFFISPMLADIFSIKTNINNILVGSYFLGISVFFIVKDIKKKPPYRSILMFAKIQKACILCEVKNNIESSVHIIFWLILSDFAPVVIQKVNSENKFLDYTDRDFVRLFTEIMIFLVLRWFKTPDTLVIIAILVNDSAIKKKAVKKFRARKSNLLLRLPKTPRRKASAFYTLGEYEKEN